MPYFQDKLESISQSSMLDSSPVVVVIVPAVTASCLFCLLAPCPLRCHQTRMPAIYVVVCVSAGFLCRTTTTLRTTASSVVNKFKSAWNGRLGGVARPRASLKQFALSRWLGNILHAFAALTQMPMCLLLPLPLHQSPFLLSCWWWHSNLLWH